MMAISVQYHTTDSQHLNKKAKHEIDPLKFNICFMTGMLPMVMHGC